MCERSILIIDGDEHLRKMLGYLLVSNGSEVMCASDEYAALKVLDVKLPDLIILDLWMPGMDGFEICKQIKGNGITSEIPIIVLTAVSSEKNKEIAISMGASDIFEKPFDSVTFLKRAIELSSNENNRMLSQPPLPDFREGLKLKEAIK